MSLSANTQAVLLLTAYFNKASASAVRPLSNKEWGKFALWLRNKGLRPESLLTGKIAELLAGWSDRKIPLERLEQLMNRGSAMALAVEKWSRAGLWVISRSDTDYPQRLKKRLKNDSPPILFGCGHRSILNQGGIAVIGCRNTSAADLRFSRDLGIKTAEAAFSIVSGGARGVDEAAMLGALEAEGRVIGVMADSLLKASNSRKYRQHIMNNNLVLVSPFYPEAGFSAGNAMQRNKYIYCLSDVAVAVHSGTKGGTWNGAIENINKQWVPLWVKETRGSEAGNAQLLAKGARCLSQSIDDFTVKDLLRGANSNPERKATDLFEIRSEVTDSPLSQNLSSREPTPDYQPGALPEPETITPDSENSENAEQSSREKRAETPAGTANVISRPETAELAELAEQEKPIKPGDVSFYDLFLLKIQILCQQQALGIGELMCETDLHKSQLTAWLKQAVEEGKVEKLKRPVRYQWAENKQQDLLRDPGITEQDKVSFGKIQCAKSFSTQPECKRH